MEESKRTIAILGGGYSGLSAAYYSAAYYLSRLGYQVTLFEKEAQVGGFSQGTQLGQVVYERVPHSFHRSDTSLLSLMTDLGMEQQLRWRPIRTAVILRDRAYGVHSVWSVLRLRPLRFLQRLVLLAGYTYLKYLSHPRKLERRPAALYTRRLFGRGVYRAIWEPILRSRFYLHMHAVNMAWFWANLKARSRRFYQGRQMLGYPIGGFHRVTEALVHRISHRGVRVCCGAEVGLLQKTDAGWLVQVNGQPHHFQQVLSTLPGATLARILDVPQADRAYAYKLQAIPYQGVVSLLFTTRQQLTTHYEHYVADTHAPFSMLVHHSALAGDESHGPLHVYYAYGYRPHEDEQMWMDEDELSNLYMEYVQKVFPALDRTAIQHMRLYRKPYAQAVPIIRYSEVQVPFQSPYPGLFVVNFSQLLPYGPTVNAAVEQGRQAARYIGGLPAGGPTAPAGTPVFSSRGPHSS